MRKMNESYNLNEDVYQVDLEIDHDDEAPILESLNEVEDDYLDDLICENFNIGDRYVNGNGAIIEITEPTKDGTTQYALIDAKDGHEQIMRYNIAKNLGAFKRLLDDNGYKKVSNEGDCEAKVDKNVNHKLPINESNDKYIYSVGTDLSPDNYDLLKQDIEALKDFNLDLVGISDNGDFTGEMFFKGSLKDIEDYLDNYVGGIQVVLDYLVPENDFDGTISSDFLDTHSFDLNQLKEELKEEVIEYDHGIGFIFPEVYDTLQVYCQWEGLLGYEDDIIDYQDTTEDDLDSYLEDEGIYGYTTPLWNILQGKEAYCSNMDRDDFNNVCADLFIDPEKAEMYDSDDVEEVDESKKEEPEIIPDHEKSLAMLNHDLGAVNEDLFNIGSNKDVNTSSEVYKKLRELAKALNDMDLVDKWNGTDVIFSVERTYEDYGANMVWKTIICTDGEGNRHQVLNPKEWIDLANGDLTVDETIKSIMDDEYCQFRELDVEEQDECLTESAVNEDLADFIQDIHDKDEYLWNLHDTDYTWLYNELEKYLEPGEDLYAPVMETGLTISKIVRRMPKEKQKELYQRLVLPLKDKYPSVEDILNEDTVKQGGKIIDINGYKKINESLNEAWSSPKDYADYFYDHPAVEERIHKLVVELDHHDEEFYRQVLDGLDNLNDEFNEFDESLTKAKKVGLVSAAKWALRKANEKLKDTSPEEVYSRALEIADRSEYPFVKNNLEAKRDEAIEFIKVIREAEWNPELDESLNENIDQQTKKLASRAISGYELMELIGTRDDIAYELYKEGIISDDVYSDFCSIIGGMTDDEYEMGYYESLNEGYNRLTKKFDNIEDARKFAKFLDPDLEPRIDQFDRENEDGSVDNWYEVYYWDKEELDADTIDEAKEDPYISKSVPVLKGMLKGASEEEARKIKAELNARGVYLNGKGPRNEDVTDTKTRKGKDLIFDRDTGSRGVRIGINKIEFYTDNYEDAVRWNRQLDAAIRGDIDPIMGPSEDEKYFDPEKYPNYIQEIPEDRRDNPDEVYAFWRDRTILNDLPDTTFVKEDVNVSNAVYSLTFDTREDLEKAAEVLEKQKFYVKMPDSNTSRYLEVYCGEPDQSKVNEILDDLNIKFINEALEEVEREHLYFDQVEWAKEFKSKLDSDVHPMIKRSGKGFEVSFDKKQPVSLGEEVDPKVIWEVDLVKFKDENLDDYDIVDTIQVTYDDINNKFNNYATKFIRTKEVANDAILNGELGHVIRSVASDKSSDKNGYEYGYGFENLRVVKNDLPSGIEKLRKELGKKLLPPLSEDGNEYLGKKSILSDTDKKAYFDSLTKYKVTRKDGSSFIVSSGRYNSLDDVKDAYKYDSDVANIEVYKR